MKQKKISKSPKKTNWKKLITLSIAVVAVAAIAWLAVVLFGNSYKTNAMKMKVNTVVAARLANIMFSDFQDNWLRVETEKLALNDKGVVVSTDDAKQVIKWRQQFFQSNGSTEALQKLMDEIDGNLGSMKLTPAKYRETKENFIKTGKLLKELVALTKNPGDSLVGMVEKISQLNTDIEKTMEPTDFNFWVTFDDIKLKADEVATTISDKNVVEQLGKDQQNLSNNAINVLKYKKLGFQELPKGKGVLYKEINKGKGPKPKDNTNVKLHYEGKLMDGTVFDSSYNRGEPVTMRPSQTVPGFWHSLLQMQAGSKWEIYIPYQEAYGNRVAGAVKPFSDLFFTIEVISLED